MSAFGLQGKVALVTGGGTGIGRATALALCHAGAAVAITEVAPRAGAARDVVAELQRAGHRAMDLTLDLRSTITIPAVIALVRKQFGQLDILVNNAGTQLFKSALELEEEEYDEVLAINLKGAFFSAQAAALEMKEHGGGCIINIASQHGVVGNINRAPYCASKGGLINLTRALAVEWAPLDIRVNAVSPTFVVTDDNRALLAQAPFADEIARDIPLGTAATPEDVAAAVVYLASPAARMITGHNLMIDGGWTAR
ncbi:SDR family NAD(P)-dependent oxidoreductase [Duganella sp. FT27W]|uniref:SDR family NAD(P)-dependent oxidoreductase n=1 Tax=Duganella sp. FT27W TaxID=2654636 RepID=UPI00128DF97F|nr:glucose 1-dehydrogenase [Duganella sp. FT27W]MPQ58887.1 glucose 1-dehydrogenase [Duganella sp. FT27W]